MSKWDVLLTIRARLFVLLLALAVPFAVYVGLSSWRQSAMEREHARQQTLGIARLTAARLDDHIGDVRQLLAVLSAAVDPRRKAMEANDALLVSLSPQWAPLINNIGIWTTSGDNAGALDARLRSRTPNASARTFFRGAMAGAELTVEAPVVSVWNGERIAVFSAPIRRRGQIVGVVAASARLMVLQTLLSQRGALTGGAVISITDAIGVVVARSEDPEVWIGRKLGAFAAAAAPGTEGIHDGPSADGTDRIGGYVTASQVPWTVYVGIPTRTALAPVRQRLAESIVAGLTAMLLGAVAAVLVGRRISRPLRQLSQDAAILEGGDLSHRSSVAQGGEIGSLAATLNRMSASLHERSAALQASQSLLQQITDNLPALISYVDRDQRFQFANNVYRDWMGQDPRDLIGQRVADVYGQAFQEIDARNIALALAGQRVVFERTMSTLSGERIVEITMVPHWTPGDGVQGVFTLIRDVTAAHEAVAQRIQSEQRLSLALEGSGAALFDWDVSRDMIYHSPQAASLRGFPAMEQSLPSLLLIESVHEDDRDVIHTQILAAVRGAGVPYEAEFRISTRLGGWVWIRAQGRVVERDGHGRAIRLAGTYTDIDRSKLAEAQLRQLADFDVLTGLPNRRLFMQRLETAIAKCAGSEQTAALLFLDIDHFKKVNDTLGHQAGDELLVLVAQTLQACVRGSDTVARLAGDEFTIILEGLPSGQIASRVAQSVVERTRRTLAADGKRVSISTSVGVALLEAGETDAAALLRRADDALYAAKASGRDRFALSERSSVMA